MDNYCTYSVSTLVKFIVSNSVVNQCEYISLVKAVALYIICISIITTGEQCWIY